MPTHIQVLKFVRQVHLYLGVFIAPAILFFAVSGALQTFSLHESTKGSNYKPAKWIVMMAQLHKKQTIHIPQRKLQTPTQTLSTCKPQKGVPGPDKPDLPEPRALLMKVFLLLVSAGLVTSTFSGLYMSYRYSRSRLVLTMVLVAGIVVPIGLAVA
jgi:hypothetical protein